MRRAQGDLFHRSRSGLDRLWEDPSRGSRWESARSLARSALQGGGELLGPGHLRWDISGPCEAPRAREVYERGYRLTGERENYWVELTMPCRKCLPCLRIKAAEWRSRAMVETGRCRATFFGTLTQAPEHHLEDLYRLTRRCHEDGVSFADLTDEQVFAGRLESIGRKVTAFQKRVRKQVHPVILRFLWVAEHHQSGLPHLHCLCHVVECQQANEWEAYPTYAALKGQWPWGVATNWSGVALDDPVQVFYACKYIQKEQGFARVRASLRYGM
jgi:hypothetical protein